MLKFRHQHAGWEGLEGETQYSEPLEGKHEHSAARGGSDVTFTAVRRLMRLLDKDKEDKLGSFRHAHDPVNTKASLVNYYLML